MKLGIIFTGGTIGCQVAEDGYLQLPDSSTYFLLEGAKERGILDGITVLPSEPFRVFSEQMTGETLSLLVHHVRERIWKEACDGWILLHGFGYLGVYRCCFGVCIGDRLLTVGTGGEQRTAFQSKGKRLDELCLCSAIFAGTAGNGRFCQPLQYRQHSDHTRSHSTVAAAARQRKSV